MAHMHAVLSDYYDKREQGFCAHSDDVLLTSACSVGGPDPGTPTWTQSRPWRLACSGDLSHMYLHSRARACGAFAAVAALACQEHGPCADASGPAPR
jgi:hypothetical protein